MPVTKKLNNMKTKKMIGGLILAAALTVGIFYACKKPGDKTQTST
jgi:hypothetical protein